jgi:hypothetical protein
MTQHSKDLTAVRRMNGGGMTITASYRCGHIGVAMGGTWKQVNGGKIPDFCARCVADGKSKPKQKRKKATAKILPWEPAGFAGWTTTVHSRGGAG